MKNFEILSEEELSKLPIDELKAMILEIVEELSDDEAKDVLEELKRIVKEDE